MSVALRCVLLTLAASPLLSMTASAQQAAELPTIEVTTPSPVAKAKPAKKASQSSAPQTAPSQSATESEAAASEPLQLAAPPGTFVVADDAFVPVTVATEREMEATRGDTITESLEKKPGIVGSTFAPGANRPIIRGLDNYRVRVQEDGIGTHDVSALSEDHAVPVDPNSADRIEVVRGPATLRYGSQAIGGVVAVENQRVPTYIPQGGFSGAMKGGWGSVDEGRNAAFDATAGSAGIVVHADGFWRRADDYDSPEGRVANTFVDSEGGSAGASLVGHDGFLGVAVARIESNYGIPAEEAHIELGQDKVLSRGACATTGSRRSASGSAPATTPTTRSTRRATSARASPTRSRRRGSRRSTARCEHRSACSTAPSARNGAIATSRRRASRATACSHPPRPIRSPASGSRSSR